MVDELGEAKRMTVLLCYHEGITHEIAAKILQVPVGTVKSRLNAALRELRGRIEEAV
jgi:DNA-directed RNA polymerase specialized sigma24 family protein